MSRAGRHNQQVTGVIKPMNKKHQREQHQLMVIKNQQRGTSSIEYVLIATLIALATIAVVQFTGLTVSSKYSQVGDSASAALLQD